MKLITTYKDQLNIFTFGYVLQTLKEKIIADGGREYTNDEN